MRNSGVMIMNTIITLDFQSRIPIYEQIIENIERYVSVGILKEDDSIPSIRELAYNLGINPNTVKKAYSELENKGVIYPVSTKGYYISSKIKQVTERKINEKIDVINAAVSELKKMGISKEDIIKKII